MVTSLQCIIRKSCAKRLRKGWRPLAWGMLCRSRHYQPFTEALKLLKIGRFFPFILLRGPILVARESHEGRPWRRLNVRKRPFSEALRPGVDSAFNPFAS